MAVSVVNSWAPTSDLARRQLGEQAGLADGREADRGHPRVARLAHLKVRLLDAAHARVARAVDHLGLVLGEPCLQPPHVRGVWRGAGRKLRLDLLLRLLDLLHEAHGWLLAGGRRGFLSVAHEAERASSSVVGRCVTWMWMP